MVPLAAGLVVLIRFPFSDLSQTSRTCGGCTGGHGFRARFATGDGYARLANSLTPAEALFVCAHFSGQDTMPAMRRRPIKPKSRGVIARGYCELSLRRRKRAEAVAAAFLAS